MASLTLDIHPETPQPNKINRVAETLHNGAVLLYPTDTGFALGCDLSHKEAIQRVRDIRQLPAGKPLTFLCESLSNIAEFAKVGNAAYKTIKRLIPGPYTFILPASKAVPRFVMNPKRKTSGIRVPHHPIALALIRALGNPIISITAKAAHREFGDIYDLIDELAPRVDVVVQCYDYDFVGESTVIDMTTDEFSILRAGAGLQSAQEYLV